MWRFEVCMDPPEGEGGKEKIVIEKWTYYNLIPTSPPPFPVTIRVIVIYLCIMKNILCLILLSHLHVVGKGGEAWRLTKKQENI